MASRSPMRDAAGSPKKYFGVLVPRDMVADPTEFPEKVYPSQEEVLKVIKKHPGSRFKCFDTREDALAFSSSDLLDQAKHINDSTAESAERAAFASVKIQELCQLRFAIERGDIDRVQALVRSNPRYLISAGDTPTVVHESFRYNALHVAAKTGRATIAQLLLDTVGDPSFLASLYPQDREDMRQQRTDYLTDMYLNTPDKGCYETPLHFACKYGFVEVVTVLLSNPKTKTDVVNKFGETPASVACTRANKQDASEKEIIQRYLKEGVCFVPLLRADDNSLPPLLGEPWSPTSDSPAFPVSSRSSLRHCSLVERTNARERPDMVVVAFAGPMLSPQGKEYKRSFAQRVNGKLERSAHRDSEKGHETVLRMLATEMRVPWHEWWDFLGCHVDLRADEGLKKLEAYLQQQQEEQRRREASSHCSGDVTTLALSLLPPPTPSAAASPPRNESCSSSISPGMSSLVAGFEKLTITTPPPVTSQDTPVRHEAGLVTAEKASVALSPEVPAIQTGNGSAEEAGQMVRRHSWSSLEYIVPSAAPVMDWLRRAVAYLPFQKVTRHSLAYSDRSTAKEVTNSSALTTKVIAAQDTAEQQHSPVMPFFIYGSQPSKRDHDVLLALSDLAVDAQRYPNIAQWKLQVMSHTAAEQASWQSPCSLPSQRYDVTSPLAPKWQAVGDSVRQRLFHNDHSLE